MQQKSHALKRRSEDHEEEEAIKKMKMAERTQIKQELAEEEKRAQEQKEQYFMETAVEKETSPPTHHVRIPDDASMQAMSPQPMTPQLLYYHQQWHSFYSREYQKLMHWWQTQWATMQRYHNVYTDKLRSHGRILQAQQQLAQKRVQTQSQPYVQPQTHRFPGAEVYVPETGHPSWFSH